MNAQELTTNLKSLYKVFDENEELLTNLDREIGDGDHGVNMLRGFKAIDEKLSGDTVSDVLKSCGMTLMSVIGGASGPLYGFSFVKMSQVAEEEITRDNIGNLIEAFKDAIASRGQVSGGEKTMYDVISKVSDKLNAGELPTTDDLQQFADDTKSMIATKGRAAYFKEQSVGTIDPGAQSSVWVLDALLSGVS
ncbi:dihydroxyacetone kinase subunit DhaL [Macrococcus armenti]|uniref:dihydroxyacetone kinase subunit DhaL n=1 Tax=Macrococcus armenti TaxID=2875764 RepID=UPI001CCDC364|nr:dihydroxyacetone kinase subunit DhaL [Macrococcus armenti]UBH15832.1 dihydroxyacetone kinase subunit L [Macrococcus armenti]UBH18192.1 dihydroxyacetone kinase subunit L [Macrococcus armenti]UBH20458.1 dihydroxyacetone kinase subunit L [Macrococcus armenti]